MNKSWFTAAAASNRKMTNTAEEAERMAYTKPPTPCMKRPIRPFVRAKLMAGGKASHIYRRYWSLDRGTYFSWEWREYNGRSVHNNHWYRSAYKYRSILSILRNGFLEADTTHSEHLDWWKGLIARKQYPSIHQYRSIASISGPKSQLVVRSRPLDLSPRSMRNGRITQVFTAA